MACSSREPVEVGFIAGLSGPNSQIGVVSRNAAMLAVAEINDSGGINGRPLELVVVDDANNEEHAQKGVESLIEAGVPLAIGPFMSSMAPVVREHEESSILFLSPTISTGLLSDRDDNFVRLMPSLQEQARSLAEQMFLDDVRSIVVAWDSVNEEYAREIADQVVEAVAGGIDVLDVRDVNPMDDREAAMRIHGAAPEAICLITSGYRGARLIQELQELGATPRIYAPHWTHTRDFIEYGGAAVEGAILTSLIPAGEPSDEYKAFVSAYRNLYDDDPEVISSYTYEAVHIAAEAIAAAESETPEAIRRSLLSLRAYQGLDDTITIDEHGDASRTTGLVTVRNGEFVPLR